MIRVENLHMEYVKKKKKTKVLENINYNFKSNTFYAIIGQSGVGKTTFIQILGLLLTPTKGKIFINNENVSDYDKNKKSIIINSHIGFVFQSFYLNPYLNTKENILLPTYTRNSSNKHPEKICEDLIKKMKLIGKEDNFPGELSGGEQQRVAIARALINNPKVILADEPTGSLDNENEINILNILKNLSSNGKCVIVVTHNDKVKNFADVVLEIKDGQLTEVDYE